MLRQVKLILRCTHLKWKFKKKYCSSNHACSKMNYTPNATQEKQVNDPKYARSEIMSYRDITYFPNWPWNNMRRWFSAALCCLFLKVFLYALAFFYAHAQFSLCTWTLLQGSEMMQWWKKQKNLLEVSSAFLQLKSACGDKVSDAAVLHSHRKVLPSFIAPLPNITCLQCCDMNWDKARKHRNKAFSSFFLLGWKVFRHKEMVF